MTAPTLPALSYEEFSRRLFEKAADQRIPLSGSLELTFRCNLRCVHCYLSDRRFVQNNNELNTEEIKDLIDQIVAEGCLWFLITGGEPFTRPDWFEILQYARKKGLLVVIFTNGTLLTEDVVQKLALFPPFFMEITLYGFTQETYERVTGVAGSHARCMRGIQLLKAYKIPFKLKTMLMTLNAHEFEQMQTFADELGVSFRYDPNLNPSLDREHSPCSFRIDPRDLLRIEQNRLEPKKGDPDCQALMNYRPADPSLLFQCGAGTKTFHIDPSGKLSPCIMARWQTYDLRSGSFKEGWFKFLKTVRDQKTAQETKCQMCNLRPLCGNCVAWSMLETGNPNDPSDYLCQIAHLRATALTANPQS